MHTFSAGKGSIDSVGIRRPLDEGSFGQVFLVKNAKKEWVVCKIIRLDKNPAYPLLTSYQLLRLAYREIYFLVRQEQLMAYEHDTKLQIMRIFMRYIPGELEFNVPIQTRFLAQYSAFCALKKLHRHGIAHMDPHAQNFIFQGRGTQVIDFGLSQDYQIFYGLRDLYYFAVKRHLPWMQLLAFIFIENIAQVFICPAYIVPSIIFIIIGLPGLFFLPSLFLPLLQVFLFYLANQCFQMLQEHFEMLALEQNNQNRLYYAYYALSFSMLVLQGSLLTYSLMMASQTFVQMMLPIVGISAFYQSLDSTFEKYVQSEKALICNYQAKVKQTQNRHFLPYFAYQQSQSHASLTSACPLNPKAHLRSRSA